VAPEPLTIPGTQVHRFSSEIAGRDFQILVALPLSYGEGEERYPVVYCTDADFMFAGAVEVARTLAYGLEAQEVIMVGIAYGGSSLEDWQVFRRRDYTPTETTEEDADIRAAASESGQELPEALSGQAHRFHRVIHEEIKPFIEGTYRTIPEENAYFGDSFGGLFGLYVLFHAPETFKRYIIGSPSIWWDGGVTLDFEAEYAAVHDDLPVDLFVSVGLLEEDPSDPQSRASGMVSNVRTLVDRLESRGYPSLLLESAYFEGETHMSVVPSNFSRGLRTLFPGPGM
jgi:predicted alpha/beta superfamily hydrolase